MLFDFKKKRKKKTSKHLIGIDAEVYILYEDKVLLKSRGKKTKRRLEVEAPFLFIFFLLGMTSLCYEQKRCHFKCSDFLILFLVPRRKNKTVFPF